MAERWSVPLALHARRRPAVALLAALMMLLAACGGGNEDSEASAGAEGGESESESADGGGEGGGLPPDASKEDYIAALEDMEPVEFQWQTSSGPEEMGAQTFQAYADAIEEWSGGKMTVDLAYNLSIAGATEAPAAMADGRLDFDYVYAHYDPARFPAGAALANGTFLGDHSPVSGTLSSSAAYLEAAMDVDAVFEEMEAEGVHLLLPYTPTTSVDHYCAEQRDTVEGAQTRTSGSAHAAQVEAIGGSPTSLAFAELFEGLERGTIDCLLQQSWVLDSLGLYEVAPHMVAAQDSGFARIPYGVGFSQRQWDELPLEARQLIYDRMDVLLQGTFEKIIWNNMANTFSYIEENGSFSTVTDEQDAALAEANEQLMAELEQSDAIDGEAYLDSLQDSIEKWEGVVEELGYPDIGNDEFVDWFESEDVDVSEMVDRMMEEILLPRRPG